MKIIIIFKYKNLFISHDLIKNLYKKKNKKKKIINKKKNLYQVFLV